MPEPTYKDLEAAIKKHAQEIDALQEALQESEERYLNLFEHSGFSIVLINTKTKERVAFNKTEYESLGYTRNEFRRLSDEDIIGGGQEIVRETENIIGDKGSHLFEARHRTKNGDIRHMLVSSVAVTINGESYHHS